MAKAAYDASAIEVLTGLEPVRKLMDGRSDRAVKRQLRNGLRTLCLHVLVVCTAGGLTEH